MRPQPRITPEVSLVALPYDSAAKFQDYARPEMLVSTDWLAEHLNDPGLVVAESDKDVLLYELTGDTSALARAEQIADAALARFAGRWANAEPPEFAAIFFRNLLALAGADGRANYVAAAESYGDAAWRSARNARTGLFAFSGKTRLLEQAALVQLYAALAVTSGG